MTDTTPEEPVTDPTPEEPAPVVVCPTPDAAAYRTRKQAEVVASMSRQLQVVECPVGHWHAVRRVVNPDAVPAPPTPPEDDAPVPAPTEPPAAPTEPASVQRRGASSSRKR